MGWFTQDDNDDSKVKVNGGYSRKDDDNPRTDFLFIDKETDTHKHVSVDQDGNQTEHHDYR